MPSLFSHAMAAAAVGSVMAPKPLMRPFLCWGAVCAVLPDLDNIGPGGIDMLGGHRGFTHSLAFALLSGVVAALSVPRGADWGGQRLRFASFIGLATATHGGLDALTRMTPGIQFLSPFSRRDYRASPSLLHSGIFELFWLFIPLLVFVGVILYVRGFRLPKFTRQGPLSIRDWRQSIQKSSEREDTNRKEAR
jgi:membrane-bound metal-dependent hydrolase YbcI (DUF457 family)